MSKKKDSLSSSLKALTEALKVSNSELTEGPTLQTVDLTVPYSHMWTPAAKLGMANRITGLVNKRENKVVRTLETHTLDRVHFFNGIAVGEDKIVKAARAVTNDINWLAGQGYVTGCLTPLSYLQLSVEPFQLPEFAVFCYISLTPEGSECVQDLETHAIEGERSIEFPNRYT